MRQNSNALQANTPGRVERVPAQLEMAALEDLGPKTLRAIDHSPLPILAHSVVVQLIEANAKIEKINERLVAAGLPERPYLDAKHPALDEALAKGIMQDTLKLLASERSIDDALAGMKPLRGQMSAKTTRENARYKRQARRWR